jgi:hypothetical protein
MKTTKNSSWLFGVALMIGQSTLLFLFGSTIGALLAIAFDAFHLAEILMWLVKAWIWRAAIILFCILAVAVVMESIR